MSFPTRSQFGGFSNQSSFPNAGFPTLQNQQQNQQPPLPAFGFGSQMPPPQQNQAFGFGSQPPPQPSSFNAFGSSNFGLNQFTPTTAPTTSFNPSPFQKSFPNAQPASPNPNPFAGHSSFSFSSQGGFGNTASRFDGQNKQQIQQQTVGEAFASQQSQGKRPGFGFKLAEKNVSLPPFESNVPASPMGFMVDSPKVGFGGGQQLKAVPEFNQLGSSIRQDGPMKTGVFDRLNSKNQITHKAIPNIDSIPEESDYGSLKNQIQSSFGVPASGKPFDLAANEQQQQQQQHQQSVLRMNQTANFHEPSNDITNEKENMIANYRGPDLMIARIPDFLLSEAQLRKYFEFYVPADSIKSVRVRKEKKTALARFASTKDATTVIKRGRMFEKDGKKFVMKMKFFVPRELLESQGTGTSTNHAATKKEGLNYDNQGEDYDDSNDIGQDDKDFDDPGVDDEEKEQSFKLTQYEPPQESNLTFREKRFATAEEKTPVVNSQPKSQADKESWRNVPDKTELSNATNLIGTCQDMCPEQERYQREVQRDLSIFEIKTGQTEGAPQVDHQKAVKKYARSAACQEAAKPEDVRPPKVLEKTLNYLVDNIIDMQKSFSGINLPFYEVHNFFRDRTRSIRQDFTFQGIRDPLCIAIHEKAVRFHILSEHVLCGEDPSVFSSKQNMEQLDKCLISLREMYAENSQFGERSFEHEAEMQAYYLLLHSDSETVASTCKDLGPKILYSEAVQTVLKALNAMKLGNYRRFFNVVRESSYLTACLLHKYFTKVRSDALHTMTRAFLKNTLFSVSNLIDVLSFEGESEAISFCTHHGLEIVDEGSQEASVRFVPENFIQNPEEKWVPRKALNLIESKVKNVLKSCIIKSGYQKSFSMTDDGSKVFKTIPPVNRDEIVKPYKDKVEEKSENKIPEARDTSKNSTESINLENSKVPQLAQASAELASLIPSGPPASDIGKRKESDYTQQDFSSAKKFASVQSHETIHLVQEDNAFKTEIADPTKKNQKHVRFADDVKGTPQKLISEKQDLIEMLKQQIKEKEILKEKEKEILKEKENREREIVEEKERAKEKALKEARERAIEKAKEQEREKKRIAAEEAEKERLILEQKRIEKDNRSILVIEKVYSYVLHSDSSELSEHSLRSQMSKIVNLESDAYVAAKKLSEINNEIEAWSGKFEKWLHALQQIESSNPTVNELHDRTLFRLAGLISKMDLLSKDCRRHEMRFREALRKHNLVHLALDSKFPTIPSEITKSLANHTWQELEWVKHGKSLINATSIVSQLKTIMRNAKIHRFKLGLLATNQSAWNEWIYSCVSNSQASENDGVLYLDGPDENHQLCVKKVDLNDRKSMIGLSSVILVENLNSDSTIDHAFENIKKGIEGILRSNVFDQISILVVLTGDWTAYEIQNVKEFLESRWTPTLQKQYVKENHKILNVEIILLNSKNKECERILLEGLRTSFYSVSKQTNQLLQTTLIDMCVFRVDNVLTDFLSGLRSYGQHLHSNASWTTVIDRINETWEDLEKDIYLRATLTPPEFPCERKIMFSCAENLQTLRLPSREFHTPESYVESLCGRNNVSLESVFDFCVHLAGCIVSYCDAHLKSNGSYRVAMNHLNFVSPIVVSPCLSASLYRLGQLKSPGISKSFFRNGDEGDKATKDTKNSMPPVSRVLFRVDSTKNNIEEQAEENGFDEDSYQEAQLLEYCYDRNAKFEAWLMNELNNPEDRMILSRLQQNQG